MVEAAHKAGFNDDLEKTDPAPVAVTAPEVKPEIAAAEPEPATPAPQDAEDGYTLEEDGFVGARDLAAKLDANPALKAALPADVRNEIMANARLAEVGAAYRELFSSPAEAKIIHQTAQEHAAFAEAFSLVGQDTEKGTNAFISKLIEGSALRDADGNVVKNPDGSIRTDGTAKKFLDKVAERGIALLITKKVEALGDENVSAALDLVMESVGLRPSTAAQDADQDPVLTARKAELDAQEARIKAERETSVKEQTRQYNEALNGDLASLYDTEVGKLLGLATALDGFTKTAVEQRLEKEIRAAIKANTAYQMRRDRIRQQPAGPERRQKEVALAKEFFRDNLVRIAKPILHEAGVAVKGKVDARAAAQAARAENARSEVNGGQATQPAPRSGMTQNPAQQYQQALEAFKTQNGRAPSDDSELNIFMMLNAAKSKGFAA